MNGQREPAGEPLDPVDIRRWLAMIALTRDSCLALTARPSTVIMKRSLPWVVIQ